MDFDAVLFDFDGVLINTLNTHIEAFRRALSDYDIEITDRDILLREGEPASVIVSEIMNRPKDDPDVIEKTEEKQRIYREMANFWLSDKRRKKLTELGLRFKQGLVTGTDYDNLREVLDEGELDIFDHVTTADDTDQGKPNPEPYLDCARYLDVKPESCVVLENAPMGVKSAKRAGMYCIAITSTLERGDLEEADEIHASFAEAVESLKSI